MLMVGLESMWALTKDAMIFTGGFEVFESTTFFGFEGKRPRRPLRLSVRTTVGKERGFSVYLSILNQVFHHHREQECHHLFTGAYVNACKCD